jgi:hypothetical protein
MVCFGHWYCVKCSEVDEVDEVDTVVLCGVKGYCKEEERGKRSGY